MTPTRAELMTYCRTHPGYLADAVAVLLRDLDAMEWSLAEAEALVMSHEAHIDRLVVEAESDDRLIDDYARVATEAAAMIARLTAERDDLRARLAAAQSPRVDVAKDEAGRRITTLNGVLVGVDPPRRAE